MTMSSIVILIVPKHIMLIMGANQTQELNYGRLLYILLTNLSTLADKSSAVVIMLMKDVDEDEEITTSYDWDVKDTQNNSGHVSLCLCSSTKCNLFMQRDACDELKLFIMSLKKVEINNNTRVNAVSWSVIL